MFAIICGKSASGKDTLLKELVSNHNFSPMISYTTRPMRDNEKNGVDYHFISKEEFELGIVANEFLEYRAYNTLVNGVEDTWYYGMKKGGYELGKDYVVVLDLDGAKSFIEHYGKANCYVVYVDVNDRVRTERAKARPSFDETEWQRRLLDDTDKFSVEKLHPLVDDIFSNEKSTIEELANQFVAGYKAHI